MKKLILILSMALMFNGTATAATEIKSGAFDAAVKSGLNLVEFYSPNCPHCRKMAPLLDKFEKEQPNTKVLKFNIEAEKSPEGGPSVFMQEKKITSWPTYVIYKDGKEIYRFKGEMDYDRFEKRASISDKLTPDQMIDIRIEELQAEYQNIGQSAQKMSDEMMRMQTRMQQIPAAIEELTKLKAEQSGQGCPDGNCG